MKEKQDLSQIVIFGGSLYELHQKYSDRKYEIAADFFANPAQDLPSEIFKTTKKQLIKQGYGGIIRANLHRGFLSAYFTGVPVRLINSL